ncbi:hypothetical protein NECAME_03355, partial [Necator americanus]
MSERIEELQDEIDRKSREYDTLKWHYKQARKAIEDERKINARQTKKLQQAMEEVSRLKALLTEHSNDSSFLIPYCGGLPPVGYDSGAGEALCSLAEAQTDSVGDQLCSLGDVPGDNISEGLSSQTEHTSTRESTAEPSHKLDNQDDMQDEVRVFRTAECDTPPPERPRAAGSPVEPLSSYAPLPDFTINNELVPQRSLSDTDIRSLVLQEEEKDEMRKVQQQMRKDPRSRSNSIRKDYDYYVRGYNEKMDDDGSVSSSEDETYRIIEKQLKKRGEVVRFQPPRVTVQPRHYKRFGKMERCALAEFDYLQDISTDVSALQSRMEFDGTLLNGHAGTSTAVKEEQMEDEDWDPDEGVSDFYRNHPCARNEPYPCTSQEEFIREEDCFNPDDYVEVSKTNSPKTPFVPPSRRDDAPLASILNPQLDNIDPRRFFADYEHNAVVRFSRIFAASIKSSSKAEIWWPSKTFHKKVNAE